MLKKLFYASASILMLALAYHLGATTATAQAPDASVVAMTAGGFFGSGDEVTVVTANGDVYGTGGRGTQAVFGGGHIWVRRSNVFGVKSR